jgi:hypothetical protein
MSLLFKSVTHALLASGMLRKGEGTYTVDPLTGELVFLGDTHPDQYHDLNPTNDMGFDLPKNARYGDRAAEGEWGMGADGEHVYTDIHGNEHRHGIDALIAKVSKIVGSGEVARQIISDAIGDYNDDHQDAKNQSLPEDIESPEWRRLTKGQFSSPKTIEQANQFSSRGKGGTFINLNMSSDARLKNSKQGLAQHPESYRIPFAPYLHDILKEDFGFNSQFDEGITHGYISGRHISPNTRRLRGVVGENLADDMTLPPEFREMLGHSSAGDVVHNDVHNWEMIQHMPLDIFNPLPEYGDNVKNPGGTKIKKENYREYMLRLLPAIVSNLNQNNTEMLDVPLFTRQDPSGPVEGPTVREIYEETRFGKKFPQLDSLIDQMAMSPDALQFMLGNPAQKTSRVNKLVNTLKDELIGHPDLKGQGQQMFDNAMERVTAGNKLGTHKKKGKAVHMPAAEFLALSGVIGSLDALTNFAQEEPAHETSQSQKDMFSLLGSLITLGHGGTVREFAPVSGEATPGLVPKYLEGHLDVNRPLPEHMQNYFVPSAMTEAYDSPLAEDDSEPMAKPEAPPPLPKPDYSNVDDAFREALSRRIQQDPSVGLPAYFQQTGRQPVDPLTLDQQQRERLMEAVRRFGAAQSPYQARLTDPYPVATSFDTLSIEDRLVKAMERVQMLEAKRDVAVLKQMPKEKLSANKEDDVSFLAMKLGITKQDVRTISNSKGDWDRIAKAYKIKPSVVKVVKVTLGGE